MTGIRMAVLVNIMMVCTGASASDTIMDEPDKDSYNFVSYYRISIDAPAEVVWKHLIDLRSWMYEFEMAHVSGKPHEEGEVLRLYPEEELLVQIIKAVPNKLMVLANLPSTFKGEYSTGVGVFTLNEVDGTTIMDITMSRRYTWQNDGPDTLKEVRGSPQFQENARTTWNKFFNRLRELSIN